MALNSQLRAERKGLAKRKQRFQLALAIHRETAQRLGGAFAGLNVAQIIERLAPPKPHVIKGRMYTRKELLAIHRAVRRGKAK